ncbi:hypothetical protein SDRG_03675 [Saprolegnia diclina VS20]|uniref:Uncharacterized protein n=1 Tax=Saprolegnia diclina (strain VS20) TaxID=1156394 RepID=T0QXC6_SAPDV|nr:hypothetical protein SDRG_03675 [Saprolegnia diclina VS20]EQC38710.1 hypothetical protein SDRG_03675 [Saprolegnia diclina VS20]|eukprot:XP_008607534.1 hypothetical protein SDRG_03675 [Saprolegnia diclina VS20]
MQRRLTEVFEALPAQHQWSVHARQAYAFALAATGVLAIAILVADAVVNNWALNNYLGGAYFLATPVASAQFLPQLSRQYSFARGLTVGTLSNVGFWMANTTVHKISTKADDIYLVASGVYPLTPDTVLCPIFQQTYSFRWTPTTTSARLALASGAITYYRGNAITNAFSDGKTANLANSTMRSDQIAALGYVPGRNYVDMRFTRDIAILNTTLPQTQLVNYFRIFPRTFCTLCDPVADLGYSVCNMTFLYNDSAKSITVKASSYVDGSTYTLGLMLRSNFGSIASVYVKLVGIFFGVGGYLASRRTVQWLDAAEGFISRVLRTVAPKYYPQASHALRFDMFCFNSDIFVFSYALSVLLDIQNCFVFIRSVNLYNNLSPTPLYSLQLFCCSMRFLWVNCAVLKICKKCLNLLGTVSFNGQSALMGALNWSSVLSLYLSAILLAYVPPFMDYNNSVSTDLRNSFEKIDGIRVDFFNSFYMRVAGSVVLGMLLNLAVVTLWDHVWNCAHWTLLKQHSLSRQAIEAIYVISAGTFPLTPATPLCPIFEKTYLGATNPMNIRLALASDAHSLARQAIYNSSSIVCDYLDGIEVEAEGKAGGALLLCRARRLSTLQWFFMSHLTCFGLPEKELRQKKQTIIAVKSKATTRSLTSDKAPPARDPSVGNDDLRETSYMVVQDGDANIHLIDGVLSDVTSLVYNIKILKNTSVTIE